MLGVIFQFYSNAFLKIEWIAFALLICVLSALPRIYSNKLARLSRYFAWMFVFFGMGVSQSFYHNDLNASNYLIQDDQASNYLLEIIEPPQEKERSVKVVGELRQDANRRGVGKVLLYLEKDSAAHELKYGDLVEVNVAFNGIQQNKNPHEFNYKRYLKIHNIFHQGYVQKERWKLVGNEGNSIMSHIYSIRQYCERAIDSSSMGDQNKMVAQALLLGQKDRLDKNTLRSYSSAGAMHVLAVSGLHVGIVMLIVGFLIRPIKKLKHGQLMYLLIVLSALWFYAILTGLSPSVLRSAIMFSFVVIGLEMQRSTSIYQSLMVSAFLLMIIDPWVIFQVGFQLSYLAVLGIVYLQPKIYGSWYVSNKILDGVWKITAVSLAAQLATFPLGLYYFHQFPNLFLISNLIVIPLAFVLLVSGIAFLTFSWVPYLSDMILLVFDFLLSVLNKGVEWIEGLPHSIYWGISIHWYEVFWIYLILIGVVVGWRKRVKAIRVLAFASCLGLFVNWYVENKMIAQENKVFVYNIKDELAIDVFYGCQNRFYSTPELLEDQEKLLFHVMHNWFYRSGEEVPTEHVNINNLSRLTCGNLNVVVIGQDAEMDKFSNSDVVVLHGLNYLSETQLKSLKESKCQVVAGPKVGNRLKDLLATELKERLRLLSDGAIAYSF